MTPQETVVRHAVRQLVAARVSYDVAVRILKDEYIDAAVDHTGGNITHAAMAIGVSRNLIHQSRKARRG